MMTAWNHLANAKHIDRVIASLKAHPEAWTAARWWARDAARAAAREAAQDAAWYAARDAAWYAARDAARYAAREAAWEAAWRAARDAVLALIAWDHSAKFLDMTPDELKMWSILSEDPACILLLPAVQAFERIAELELA